ncbi:MAG: DUF1080 domain-containing protein [Planctomycetes bacterium]|nr:DUF1080 domain-containing protein [Planctomycetota bacterium]
MTKRTLHLALLAAACLASAAACGQIAAGPTASAPAVPSPAAPAPAAPAPTPPPKAADAGAPRSLLPGPGMAGWKKPTGDWQMVGEAARDPADEKAIAARPGAGAIYNGPKGRTVNIFTEEEFGDAALHVEFMIPKGSNSGVYLMGRYEIQIYDSFGVDKDKYPGIECGGIYERWDPSRGKGREGFEGRSPRANASRPPGEWQTFDILFRAPRFDAAGNKTANAKFVKVVHNGQVVHENVEVTGPTRGAAFNDEKPAGPLMLQGDHGPVAYRNLTVSPLRP